MAWKPAAVLGVIAATLLPHNTTHGAQRRASAFQVVETTIDAVHAAYRAGTLTARQLTQAYLDRIAGL